MDGDNTNSVYLSPDERVGKDEEFLAQSRKDAKRTNMFMSATGHPFAESV